MPRPAGPHAFKQMAFRFAREESALALIAPSKRFRGLLRERDQLITKVKRKGEARDTLSASVQSVSAVLRGELSPLLGELGTLSQEIHGHFHALLADRMSHAARRAVRDVYQALVYTGVLAPYVEEEPEEAELGDPFGDDDEDEDEDEDWEDEREPEPAATRRGAAPPRSAASPPWESSNPSPDAEEEHPSAHQPAGRPSEQSSEGAMKALFRQLAGLLHPDRVQHKEDKAKRTEAMKELTRAYAQGNLAAMLAVQQQWESNTAAVGTSSEPSSEQDLQRTVKQLKVQLRDVEHELRELQRESPLADVPGFVHKPGVDPAPAIAQLVGQVQAERDVLVEVRRFVLAFAQKRMTLVDFKVGPNCLRQRRVRSEAR